MRKSRLNILSALVLCVALLMSMVHMPVAAAIEADDSDPVFVTNYGDTLSRTAEEYMETADAGVMTRASSSRQAADLCEAFLAAGRASSRSSAYSCAPMTLASINEVIDDTVAYRISEYDYRGELFAALGWEITSDNLQFTEPEVIVDGNTATVRIVEKYTYFMTGWPDKECGRMREYTFTLVNENGTWKVSAVTSNDPWETEGDFDYVPFDVNELVATEVEAQQIAIDAPQEPVLLSAPVPAEVAARASLDRYGISDTASIRYAEKYWGTTNKLFGASTKNCQNFASQCVWAGFLGAAGTDWSGVTDRNARPAVSLSIVSSDAKNLWCRNQVTTAYSDYRANWGWDNVVGFATLIEYNASHTSTSEGPFGEIYQGFRNAGVGDVLWYCGSSSETASTDNIIHAMFVTDINDNSGIAQNLTASDVFIAANTSQSNGAFEPLSTYKPSYTDKNYIDGKVYGGNYAASF